MRRVALAAIGFSILIEADPRGFFHSRSARRGSALSTSESEETMTDDKLKLTLLDIILNLARTPGTGRGDVQTASAFAEIATIAENQFRRHRAHGDDAPDIG